MQNMFMGQFTQNQTGLTVPIFTALAIKEILSAVREVDLCIINNTDYKIMLPLLFLTGLSGIFCM